MEKTYLSCLHFSETEKVKVCEFLDKNGYEYTLRLLSSPINKNMPWSIKMRGLTLDRLEKYVNFIETLGQGS